MKIRVQEVQSSGFVKNFKIYQKEKNAMVKQPEVRYINAYVSGSVAYQLERKPVKKNVVLPKQRKKKKVIVRVDPVAILGIFTAVVMLVMLLVGMVRLQNAREETAALGKYVYTLKEENLRLQEKYDASYDLEEIRELALAMGMVPVEQLDTIQIEVPPVAEEVTETEKPTLWDNVCTFLAGLFA